DGSTRSDLIDNMLIEDTSQERQIKAIVELIQRNAFQGIELDYRGISPELRDEYVQFLKKLDQALPDNKILSVQVELPHQVTDEEWDTGGYDWQAIGEIADIVKMPTFPAPQAYKQGGQMDSLLSWAVGQVNRYKIQLLLTTHSTEEVNGALRT